MRTAHRHPLSALSSVRGVVLLLGRHERAAGHLGADVPPVRLLLLLAAAADEPERPNDDVAEGHRADDDDEGDEHAVGDAAAGRDCRRVLGERAEDVARRLDVARVVCV